MKRSLHVATLALLGVIAVIALVAVCSPAPDVLNANGDPTQAIKRFMR